MKFVALSAIVITLVSCASAQALLTRYEFSGTVTSATGGLVSTGQSFSGTFTYESSTPDAMPGNSDVGWYLHPNPLGFAGVSVDIGPTFTYTLEQDATFLFSVQRIANPSDDLISIRFVDASGSTPHFPTVTRIQGDFDLRGPDGLFGGDDSLPTSIDLADFTENREFTIQGFQPSDSGGFLTVFFYRGEITSLTPVAIPESNALLCVGFVCLGFVGHRARSKSKTSF